MSLDGPFIQKNDDDDDINQEKKWREKKNTLASKVSHT